ncbi:MAG: hypothetical protein EXQ71_03580 [Acidimicrobiia bacterium]|nr:hypothetical protein [Acidimicrobiia bacterium]
MLWRRWTVLLCAWTLIIWTTRISNIWNDDALSNGEKWGRTGLAVSFTVLALATLATLWRKARGHAVVLKALAGWTIGVWLARSVGIATGDHAVAFVAVHLGLAGVSIALSVLALREQGRAAPVA